MIKRTSLTRTTVYVDSADLATIKEAALDEPLDLGGRVSPDDIRGAVTGSAETPSADRPAA